VIVLNEDHLRRILSNYASYYNEVRTHLSLRKDTPDTRPIERFGDIIAQPILGVMSGNRAGHKNATDMQSVVGRLLLAE